MKTKLSYFVSALVVLVAYGSQAQTTPNLLDNPGAETGTIDGWTSGGVSNPSVDNGSFDPGINPHSGNFDFYGNNGPNGTLSQIAGLIGTDGLTATEINAGTATANVSFWEQGLNQGTPSDNGFITVTFLDSGNVVIGSDTTPTVDSHDETWENFAGSYAIPAGTASIDYTMNFERNVGSDLDTFFDDNSLTVTIPGGSTVPDSCEYGWLALVGVTLLGRVWRNQPSSLAH